MHLMKTQNKNDISQIKHLFGLQITERCNLHCGHCLFSADKNGKDMSLIDLVRWLNELDETRQYTEIGFSGGEPFIAFNLLREGITKACSLGLKTTVVTNAFWADSLNNALKILKKLGPLSLLGVSFDKFHQEFIPIDNLRNAILAANHIGIKTTIRFTYLWDENLERKEVERIFSDITNITTIESQPMLNAGRASHFSDENGFENAFDKMVNKPCAASNVHMLAPDGTVYLCCGPAAVLKKNNPLKLGNLYEKSFKSILEDEENNLIIQAIRVFGPSYLLNFIEEKGCFQDYESKKDHCDLCLSLMENTDLIDTINMKLHEQSIERKIAVMRFLLYQENEMLRRLDKATI